MVAHLTPFSDLTNISAPFQGLLLDAYGVFWGGNDVGLFPGTKEAMKKLVLEGKIVGILSNSTQLASKEISKLQLHGLVQGTHFHFLITSGEIAKSLFLQATLPFDTPRNTFWLFGGAHPKFSSHEVLFKDTVYKETVDLYEADFIYVSIPHIDGVDQVDPELFRKEIAKAREYGLPMVCPNPDRFAHEGKPPRAVVRQGSIALMYEEMGGQVFYIGKPSHRAYSAAFDQFCQRQTMSPKDILMVGDTPETDIRGARSFGMSSALVLQTGIMADRIANCGLEQALQSLPSLDFPSYLIQRFGYGVCSSS